MHISFPDNSLYYTAFKHAPFLSGFGSRGNVTDPARSILLRKTHLAQGVAQLALYLGLVQVFLKELRKLIVTLVPRHIDSRLSVLRLLNWIVLGQWARSVLEKEDGHLRASFDCSTVQRGATTLALGR